MRTKRIQSWGGRWHRIWVERMLSRLDHVSGDGICFHLANNLHRPVWSIDIHWSLFSFPFLIGRHGPIIILGGGDGDTWWLTRRNHEQALCTITFDVDEERGYSVGKSHVEGEHHRICIRNSSLEHLDCTNGKFKMKLTLNSRR